MLINGIKAKSYTARDGVLSIVIDGTVEDAKAFNAHTVTVMTDAGSIVEVITGYVKRSIKIDADLGTVTIECVEMDGAEADAIKGIAADIADTKTAATNAETVANEAKQAAEAAGTDPQVKAAAKLFVASADLTDEQALTVSTLYDEWSGDGVAYAVDQIVRYGTALYRCEQAHTSQEGWAPDSAASLWSRIDLAGDGVEVWTQPTGAHNAYNTGDRVHYPDADGPIYTSTIDGNVWAPDAYPQGWQLEEAE